MPAYNLHCRIVILGQCSERRIAWLFSFEEHVGAIVEKLLEPGVLINFLLLFGPTVFLLVFLIADVGTHMHQGHVADEDNEQEDQHGEDISRADCKLVTWCLFAVNDGGETESHQATNYEL